jgi:hypothetical protein
MRGPSNPSANSDISNPGGSWIDLPGNPSTATAFVGRGNAVGAGKSGSRLGLPMFKVQAGSRISAAEKSMHLKRFILIILIIKIIKSHYPRKIFFEISATILILFVAIASKYNEQPEWNLKRNCMSVH